MHNIIAIIGGTGRGKDTLANYLQKKYGLKPVVSYATRPKRPREKEGREHYFISKEKALEMLETGEAAVSTQIGENIYFSTIDEIMKKDIYVIDPDGVNDLLNLFYEFDLDVNIKQVYITSKDSTAYERAMKRGDDPETFYKRSEDEHARFLMYTLNMNWDYYYSNDGSIEELLNFGDYIYNDIYKK